MQQLQSRKEKEVALEEEEAEKDPESAEKVKTAVKDEEVKREKVVAYDGYTNRSSN